MSRVEGYDDARRAEDLFDPYYSPDSIAIQVGRDGHWFGNLGNPTSTEAENYLGISDTIYAYLELIRLGEITIPEHARALDIGSGTGHDLIRCLNLGYEEAVGIDISGQGVLAAKGLVSTAVDANRRGQIGFYKYNLFEALPTGGKFDLVWSRGDADYTENHLRAIGLGQNETKLGGTNVFSAVVNEPKSLLGLSSVPCHNKVPLKPVSIEMVRELYSPERGWTELYFQIVRDKEDTSHPDGEYNPKSDRHSHDIVNGIWRYDGANAQRRSRSGLVIPQLIRGKASMLAGK
jgi:SAM-dependent methyltransferase